MAVYSSLNYAESQVDSRVISIPLERAKGYRAEGTVEYTLGETLKSFFWNKEFEGLRAEESAPVTEAPAAETEAPAPEGSGTPAATEAPAQATEAPAPESGETVPAGTEAPVETPVPETGNRMKVNVTRENFRDYFRLECRCGYKEGKVTFSYEVFPVNDTFDAAEDTATVEIRLHVYSSLNYAESEVDSRVISIPLEKAKGYRAEGTEEYTLEEAVKSFFWDREIERVLIDGNDPAEGFVLVTEGPAPAETAAPQAASAPEGPKDPARTELTAENFRDYFSVDCGLDYREGKAVFRYAVSPSKAYAEADGAADTVTAEIRVYLYSSLNYADSGIGSMLVTVTLEKGKGYCCEGAEEYTPEEEYKSIFWDKKIENASGWVME